MILTQNKPPNIIEQMWFLFRVYSFVPLLFLVFMVLIELYLPNTNYKLYIHIFLIIIALFITITINNDIEKTSNNIRYLLENGTLTGGVIEDVYLHFSITTYIVKYRYLSETSSTIIKWNLARKLKKYQDKELYVLYDVNNACNSLLLTEHPSKFDWVKNTKGVIKCQ